MNRNILQKSVFAFWLLLGVLVFFASFKDQIILSKTFQKQISFIFPEGWGFFTKNPRDLLMDVYKIDHGKLKKIDMSNHSFDNYLGLSRKARMIGYGSSHVSGEISKETWVKSTSDKIKDHINDSTFVVKRNDKFHHFENGEYLFKLYKQIPYAWANKSQEKFNPCQFARIKIVSK